MYTEKGQETCRWPTGHQSHHQIYQVGGDAIPEHDSHWDYEDRVGQARMRHYNTCLSEGMKRCMVKPVNYDKVREVTQEKGENQQSSRAG